MKAPIEDVALVERLRAGDAVAFEALVTRHHDTLVRVALTYVGNRASAEELAQETWLGVIHGLKEFEGRASLKTWIFRILTNRAKTRAVRERRSLPFSALAADPSEAAVDATCFDARGRWQGTPQRRTPESILTSAETLRVLSRALDDLPPAQRAVVILRDVEGLSGPEVCNVLELSETNQRVLLHRGRARLRRAVETHLRET